MINIFKSFPNITQDNSLNDNDNSKTLVRTNVSLSGNIKIVVDESEKIWLNSIGSHPELDRIEYQKYAISSVSSFPTDVYNFLNKGKIDPSILYYIPEFTETSNNKSSFNEEYEDIYLSGAQYVKSKLWDEPFSYFAPIWLDKTIPEYFVIFSADDSFSLDSNNQFNWNDLIKNSRIVKSFSLKEDSEIGKYIKNIRDNVNYKGYPLSMNFDNEKLSTWNGVLWDKGIIGERGEFLADFWQNDRPIIETEEWVIKGFQRNKIISSNLLNLEFLFSDKDRTWEKNRYFGLYLSENQLGSLNANVDMCYVNTGSGNSSIKIRSEKNIWDNSTFITNENGVKIWLEDIGTSIDWESIKEPYISYLKVGNNFVSYSDIKSVFNGAINKDLIELTLKKKSFDLSDIFSRSALTLQERCDRTNSEKANFTVLTDETPINVGNFIEFVETGFKMRFICNNTPFEYGLTPNSFFSTAGPAQAYVTLVGDWTNSNYSLDWITYYNGTTWSNFLEVDNLVYNSMSETTRVYIVDTVTFTTPTIVSLYSNRYYDKTEGYNSVKDFYYFYFNNLGSLEDTIWNINGSINSSQYPISGYFNDHQWLFFNNNSGEQGNNWKARFYLQNIVTTEEVMTDVEVLSPIDNVTWNLEPTKEFSLKGGLSQYKGIVVDNIVKQKIISNNENFFSCVKGWSKCLSITKKIGNINWNEDQIEKIDNIEKWVINLNDDIYLTSFGDFNMFSKVKCSIGVFTIFPIVDWEWNKSAPITKLYPEFNHLFKTYTSNSILIPNYQYYAENVTDVYELTETNYAISSYTIVNDKLTIKISNAVPINLIWLTHTLYYAGGTYSLTTESYYTIGAFHYVTYVEADPTLLLNTFLTVDVFYGTLIHNNVNTFVALEGYYSSEDCIIDFTPSKDFMNWKGFDGIRDFLNFSDEETLLILSDVNGKTLNQIIDDREKYLSYKLLNNPYSRMREIWTKEHGQKNIINPNIISWEIPGQSGDDCPYYLNNSLSYGESNLSANGLNKNWEYNWFLIQCPNYINVDDKTHSYKWSYSSWSDEDHNKFINGVKAKYVLSDGYPHTEYRQKYISNSNSYKLDNSFTFTKEKYSKFEVDDSGKLYTFFLGNKIQIANNSTKWKDWTFSIKCESKPYTSLGEPPIEWKVWEYENIKHIQFVIQIFIAEYRNVVDLLFLTTNTSSYKWEDPLNTTGNVLLTDSHRLSSTLTMCPLSYINGLENWIKVQPFKMSYPNGEEFIPFKTNLYEELLLNVEGTFASEDPTGTVNLPGTDEDFRSLRITWDATLFPGLYDLELTNMTNLVDSNMTSIPLNKIYKSDINANTWTIKNVPFGNTSMYNNAQTYYFGNVTGINRNLLNRVSFAYVQKMLDEEDTQLQTWKYTENNVVEKSNLKLKFISPIQVKLKNEILPSIDENKPETYKNIDVIGYNLTSHSTNKNIWRHNGFYKPTWKNLTEFKVTDDLNLTFKRNIEPFKFFDTTLGIHKISTNEIMRVSEQNKFPSLYPLIGDTVLDKKDVSIWTTLWDDMSYREYSNINEWITSKVIKIWKEKKRMMGSTLFTTPKETVIYGGTWIQNPVSFSVESEIKQWFYTNTVSLWDELEDKGLVAPGEWEKYWNENLNNFFEIYEIQLWKNPKSNLWGNSNGIVYWKNNGWSVVNIRVVETSKWKRDISNWTDEDSSLTALIKIRMI